MAALVCCLLLILQSCSVTTQINTQAHKILMQDAVISNGHIGISIFEPATNTYWYNYNADKYFVPASNVKLFTTYAGLRHLGDSLVGLRYTDSNVINIDSTVPITSLVKIFPTGDPSFLNDAYVQQPVLEFLKKQRYIEVCNYNSVPAWGKGWAWDDYVEPYMAARSYFPMYKNIIQCTFINKDSVHIFPSYFAKHLQSINTSEAGFTVQRDFFSNTLTISPGNNTNARIPYYPINETEILKDTLKRSVLFHTSRHRMKEDADIKYKIIHSQPTDAVLAPMMHNSDNFLAEQILLMAGNEHLGYMNVDAIIDTLLKNELKDIPQQPQWVDGSGLSRYNLFTPQSFVYILAKMKNEFGFHRLKNILPTGGQGTLKNYYKSDSGFIYAKTGTLSNQVTLSGYLITQKNKLLIFSLLTNNANGEGWLIRRAYERFLHNIRERY